MSKNRFTGTATQPQRNRNATANLVNLIRTSTVTHNFFFDLKQLKNNYLAPHACESRSELFLDFRFHENCLENIRFQRYHAVPGTKGYTFTWMLNYNVIILHKEYARAMCNV